MTVRSNARAHTHLAKEPVLKRLIRTLPAPKWESPREPFEALCRAIIYQQLSGKAAATIFSRFVALYHRGLTPAAVSRTSIEKFRTVGVSKQKASYLIDLSEKFLDGTVVPAQFGRATDEDIRAHLMKVKGIGRWSADMFLLFTLRRPDVFPLDDLGIQNALRRAFKLRTPPTKEKMAALSRAWSPFRSLATRYLWDSLDAARALRNK